MQALLISDDQHPASKITFDRTSTCLQVEKKQGGPSSPSFQAPQTPPSFNGRPGGRAEKAPTTLRRDAQGREWTPEDVLMVSGKANLLPLLSGGLYNIAKVQPAPLPTGCTIRYLSNAPRITCSQSLRVA